MKFRSLHNYGDRHVCASGSRYRTTAFRCDDYKTDFLQVNKVADDVYKRIQEAKNGLLVSDLIQRSRLGDDSAIVASLASEVDLTNMPKDLMTAYNGLIEAQRIYDGLPSSVRYEYGNCFERFLEALNDGSFSRDYKVNRVSKAPVEASFSDRQVEQLKSIFGGVNNA